MADWGFWFEHPTTVGGYQAFTYDYRNISGSFMAAYNIRLEPYSNKGLPLIPGVYTFTIVPGGVTIASDDGEDASNPLLSSTPIQIIGGWNKHLIPGMEINLAGASVGNIFQIGIGCDFVVPSLPDTPYWVRRMPQGPVIAGQSLDALHLRVYNESAYSQLNCVAYCTNAVRVKNQGAYDYTGDPIPFRELYQFGPTNPTADEDLDGAIVTFVNVTPGAYFPTCDILVDGSPISIYDVTEDTTYPTGESLPVGNLFQFSDGTKYQSVRFTIHEDVAEDDYAMIYVSDAAQFITISLDDVTYVPGTTGIVLTESGESSGVVTSGGYVDAYIKISTSIASTSDLNMRLYNFRAQGDAA